MHSAFVERNTIKAIRETVHLISLSRVPTKNTAYYIIFFNFCQVKVPRKKYGNERTQTKVRPTHGTKG